MIQNCLLEKPLPVYGNGSNVRDWLYVTDHVEAIWRILERGISKETYDIGADTEKSNLELLFMLIDMLAEQTGKNPKEYHRLIQFVPDRLGHDFRYAIDGSKIKKSLGWSAKVSLQEGLFKTIQSLAPFETKASLIDA
jgi:dTDP-glucose 4,6-dehydratase